MLLQTLPAKVALEARPALRADADARADLVRRVLARPNDRADDFVSGDARVRRRARPAVRQGVDLQARARVSSRRPLLYESSRGLTQLPQMPQQSTLMSTSSSVHCLGVSARESPFQASEAISLGEGTAARTSGGRKSEARAESGRRRPRVLPRRGTRPLGHTSPQGEGEGGGSESETQKETREAS